MNYSVQERPIEQNLFQYQNQGEFSPMGNNYAQSWRGDAVSRQYDPTQGGVGQIMSGLGNIGQGMWNMSPPAMLWNLMQQLSQWMQGQQQQQGNGQLGYVPPNQIGDNEQYFNTASGGSNGDPHLSFNGATWDNMGSQPDLLHSDSFQGGYQLSTQTTTPQANGITYNQSATVTTNYGATSVSLDKNGNATISQDGSSFAMQPGTSYDLGNGEFAQRNQDGSLAIMCDNGQGGQITTTMRENGNGVDVNTSTNNVDLGGALVNNGNQTYHQHRSPMHGVDAYDAPI